MKQEKKLLKSEKIRLKNDRLRATGKLKDRRWSGKLISGGVSSVMTGGPVPDPGRLDRMGGNIELNKNERRN